MSALVLCGFMSPCIGQWAVSENITIQTFDQNGQVEILKMEGAEALAFDIPSYIKDHNHLERIVINGFMKSDLETKILKYDSKNTADSDGDYLCEEVKTSLRPYIGVRVEGRDDLQGVDVNKVVHASPAAISGIETNETILQFNGEAINSYCDLRKAIGSSTIGSSVELGIAKGSSTREIHVTVGAREVNTITYKYCDLEPVIEAHNEDNAVTANLSAYPNPTRSISHMNFTSSSEEGVVFYVMDLLGNLIHEASYPEFNGSLRVQYDFQSESDGTYLFIIQQGAAVYKSKVHLVKQ